MRYGALGVCVLTRYNKNIIAVIRPPIAIDGYSSRQVTELAAPHASQTESTDGKPRYHILVVDDEEPFRELLRMSLERAGYEVTVAKDGLEAIELYSRRPADLVLMDVMMPRLDGLEASARLREMSDVPIVMLTALSRPEDIVHGFDIGADDYIAKPFTFREVEVRLLAILRRIAWSAGESDFNVIALHGIELNDEMQTVAVRSNPVHLTPIEYQLLRELMTNPDRPISKAELFQRVWGYEMVGGTNLVEVAIRRLREKIENDPSSPIYLVTVRGAGYKFSSEFAG